MTSWAVSGSPFGSWSFIRTPGATAASVTSSSVDAASILANGGLLGITMSTDPRPRRRSPSFSPTNSLRQYVPAAAPGFVWIVRAHPLASRRGLVDDDAFERSKPGVEVEHGPADDGRVYTRVGTGEEDQVVAFEIEADQIQGQRRVRLDGLRLKNRDGLRLQSRLPPWRVVHRSDDQGRRRGFRGVPARVQHAVGELVGSVEVRDRCVLEGAVLCQAHVAVGGWRHELRRSADSFSGSVSLARTPGAGWLSVTSSSVTYESGAADRKPVGDHDRESAHDGRCAGPAEQDGASGSKCRERRAALYGS